MYLGNEKYSRDLLVALSLIRINSSSSLTLFRIKQKAIRKERM